jgi:hypothetical protein
VPTYFQPDWHPTLNSVLGPIKGQFGMVTETGAIKLVTSERNFANLEVKKGDYVSSEVGPVMILTAESSLGFF